MKAVTPRSERITAEHKAVVPASERTTAHKLVAAAMEAHGMSGVKRIVSHNVIEPNTVTRYSHSWQMINGGLEVITKLP